MQKPDLYPLQFNPIFKYRIWGGDKLKNLLHKNITKKNIGESWEISAITNDETQVSQGALQGKNINELIALYGDAFMGKHLIKQYQGLFPLLIKYIDAQTPLSIQVHPHDEIAKTKHQSFGKNEMWYIMEAMDEAEIIVGFNQILTKESYQKYLENDEIKAILNIEKVQKGEIFNIPTGRIHAIGAGVLLAEIQQSSDITYRIYDYNRIDATTGKTRELHNDLAISTLDFELQKTYKSPYTSIPNQAVSVVNTPYFITAVLTLTTSDFILSPADFDSFVILMVVEGDLAISYNTKPYDLAYGSCILLPASLKNVHLQAMQESCKVLLIRC